MPHWLASVALSARNPPRGPSLSIAASSGRLSLQALSLSELQFGAPAAEREMDRFQLPEYFVESQAFHRISNGNRRLLLGNRGAGKSAIFAMVSAHERLAD